MALKEHVMESAFSFKLWWSLLLIKLFAITGKEGVCHEVCFYFQAFTESDITKLQAFIIYGSERFCDEVSDGVSLQ